MHYSKLLIALGLQGLCTFTASAQKPHQHGHRLPNIAVGINHRHDSVLVSRLNIGLNCEVDSLRGLQIAAFSGGIRQHASGVMVAGIANAAHAMNGVQLSSFTNIVFTPMRGLQLCPLTNIAMGMDKGVQISAIANISSAHMCGLQLSAYNYADTLRGSQIGLINVAQNHPKGVQVGILNYSGDTIGHKIGLININPRTQVDMLAFAGTTSRLNLGFRFRNKSTYSIIGIGTHYMGFNNDFSGTLYYRLGQYFRLSPRWTLSGDLGFYHIETFQHKTDEHPERMYSLQAHLNVDYQITPVLGAFVSAGYGTTRLYGSHRNYKTQPLVEAGISIRYRSPGNSSVKWETEEQRDREYQLGKLSEAPNAELYRFDDPGYNKPHWWRAAAMTTGINVAVHSFDRFVLNEDFAKVTFKTIGDNFTHGFVWDNDQFSTNLFAHPYHGNLYFNSARSNGLNFWQSAPYALGGSLMWELCGEIEPPAINDLIATTFGGICIGEVTHRVSDLILNDHTHGFNRFLREAAATLINPMQGLTRIMNGDAWKVRREHYLYHDFAKIPVEFTMTVGGRYLADDGALFKGARLGYLNMNLTYGDAFKEEATKPYDYFTANVSVSLSSRQPLINGVHIMGRLWSENVYNGKQGKTVVGIYQHFNYYDSKPIANGTSLTPYRISEAAAFGPGIMWQFPKVGNLARLEQRVFADLILLGGTKSDYYNVIDRDYNMGSGWSFKTNTLMDFPHIGRFVLNIDYYRLFTWKGYEQKDLTQVNPLFLNSQGDKSNAEMLVINPLFLFHLRHNLGVELSGSYFMRKTRYAYHDDVNADTFEMRMGLMYRF